MATPIQGPNNIMSIDIWHYDDLNPNESGRTIVSVEDKLPIGWYTLQVWTRCPGRCVGGEVLAGDELVQCSVCNPNDGTVPLGIGGAQVYQSWTHQDPDEPDLVYAYVELRKMKLLVDLKELEEQEKQQW